MNQIKVWDPLVRILHWGLAILIFSNFLNEDGHTAHRWIGYVATGFVLVRIVWGFVGTQHARFSDWFPSPRRVIEYTKLKLSGQAPRYIGHNPAGGAMIVVLLVLLATVGTSGWMMGLDQFWGVNWVETLHETAANVLIGAVALHVIGAIVESVRHRENLPLAMVTGYKRAPTGTDIDHAPAAD